MTIFEPPAAAGRRIAVRVTPDAERHIRSGHPWVFDGSITSVSHDGAPGDLAVIFDRNRDFLAIGLWDPTAPIRVRVLHHGRPKQIDTDHWGDVVTAALSRRGVLIDEPETTACRLLHGENDGVGGLVVDRYDDTLVAKLYTPAWLPHLNDVLDPLASLVDATRVVVRLGRSAQRHDMAGLSDGCVLSGPPVTSPIEFLENGLVFSADVLAGQKTGHFLDQRDNRSMVRALADGADVLDVFSNSGGFSVHAAAGGARRVVSVDQAGPALRAAEANMAANSHVDAVAACTHQTVRGDAFEAMEAARRRGDRFDLVVVDPPSFASRRDTVAGALRAYGRLTRLAVELCADGATLVQASCSSRVTTEDFEAVVRGAAADVGLELRDALMTGHAVDHPVSFPEGAYLKAIFARPG